MTVAITMDGVGDITLVETAWVETPESRIFMINAGE